MNTDPKLPADTRLLIYAMGVFQKYGRCAFSLAQNANGRDCNPTSVAAVSFSLLGALRRAESDLRTPLAAVSKARVRIRRITGFWTTNYAATHTKAQVIAAFKKAALAMPGEG